MASKKDKLTKKIQEEIKKNIASDKIDQPKNEYSEVVQEIHANQNSQEKEKQNFENLDKKNQDKENPLKNKENMSKKRDSIYNVSADLRLEDYVEDNQKREYGPIIRNVLIFLLILLLIAGIWQLGMWLFAPKYYLSISNTEITEENYKNFLENNTISLYPGQLLHIRFTYLEKKSDYYTIQILRMEGNTLTEEAILGRKIPKTVNYIYFAGPIDPGSYVVKVLDKQRNVIVERNIEVVNP
ncbi:MAG: hypothetical protein KatS3mg129_3276 [Leptospiraceae bacterium]|nr:MAG: hypothetical protein KatS3mg129_0697 [Leptospiraceae bacterium]GIX43543.1 MAG: hypothetical protein KatS3mg129_3276 [Leptospiraceae bacterium]